MKIYWFYFEVISNIIYMLPIRFFCKVANVKQCDTNCHYISFPFSTDHSKQFVKWPWRWRCQLFNFVDTKYKTFNLEPKFLSFRKIEGRTNVLMANVIIVIFWQWIRAKICLQDSLFYKSFQRIDSQVETRCCENFVNWIFLNNFMKYVVHNNVEYGERWIR